MTNGGSVDKIVIKEKIWQYLTLEIFPDPSIFANSSLEAEFNNFDVSLSIWQSLFMSSLNKLYGLIGEASPYEIMVRKSKHEVVLKIQFQDLEKFSNCFLSYTFNLSRFSDLDLPCFIRVVNRGEYIGQIV
ncbi:uncharacterized protein LODBEIA_P13950 [Lodderomyces beijingensis]|uniref:Ribonucleases P/MRP subunit Pop8-like domain-containing protein n=1 Tax=Lodderomyces beijingensis TaxID=1775926 RepID=A0ABP0ZJX5_9ASCO